MVEDTVQLINIEYSEAIILRNSSAVAFYAQGPMGPNLAQYYTDSALTTIEKTKVLNSLLKSDLDYASIMEQATMSRRNVIYVHHAFFTPIGSARETNAVLKWLDGMGLARINQWGLGRISKITGRYLDFDGHPEYRITGIHFRNPDPLPEISTR
jgi:hypothetical protein